MSIFSSIAGVASGLLGSWWNSKQQSINNDWASSRDFERNARMSWQMWNATNQYNSPVEQMKRFKDAGLNPNLIYGSMPQSPQPAVVKSSTSPAEYKFDLAQSLNMFNQLENSKLNNELTRAEISNKLQQKDINDVAMSSTLASIALAKQRLGFDAQQAQDSHNESLARQRMMSANTLRSQLEYDKERQLVDFFNRITPGENNGSVGRAGLNAVMNFLKPLFFGFAR